MTYLRPLSGLCALLLSGCGPSEPVTLNPDQHIYVGTWQHLFSQQNDQYQKINNVVLRINPDSSAYYMRCQLVAEGYDASDDSYKCFARVSVTLPSAQVIRLEPNLIELEQNVEWFHFDYELDISTPINSNGDWTMTVDKTQPTRVDDDAAVDISNRNCPAPKAE